MLMSDLNRIISTGATSVIVRARAFTISTGAPKTDIVYNTAGLVVKVAKNTAALASVGTLKTMTAGTFTSLGFVHESNGIYQIGIPNVQWDTAGTYLVAPEGVTDCYFVPETIPVTAAANAYAAAVDADVKYMNGTAVSDSELTSVPAANASLDKKIRWLFLLARNKITQTATTQTVYADDGTTTVATSTVSDNGTTATRGELG